MRVVLTSYDDFPVHQASVPIALSATSDVNHYDRYFFNGVTRDGSVYFAVGDGAVPEPPRRRRRVLRRAGGEQQASVFASGVRRLDRRDATKVGPIRVDVVDPLHTVRLLVDAPEQGIRAELTFVRRSPALEEPHFFQRHGNRVFFDYTRLTQFGTWARLDRGRREHIDLDPTDTWAARAIARGASARSARPCRTGRRWRPAVLLAVGAGQLPVVSTHFDVNEYADGRRWHEVGALAPVGDGDGDDAHRRLADRLATRDAVGDELRVRPAPLGRRRLHGAR